MDPESNALIMRNLALGIRNPSHDWNAKSKLHEQGIWSIFGVDPDSKTVLYALIWA